LLLIPGWSFPMSSWHGLERAERLCAGLAGLGRLILFDRRGVGLSDRTRLAPDFEGRMEDARAVLDAVGSSRTILVGISEGAPIALLFAASYPGRVRGLVLVGAFARFLEAADHPWGWPAARLEALRAYVASHWGAGATIRAIVPRHGQDPD